MVCARVLTALCLVLAISVGARAAELRIGLANEPTYIDPHAQEIGPNVELRLHIFDSLVRLGPNEELQPGLAVSWRLVEGPLLWEFKMRPGARFHDGTPVTAHDAAFSIERAPQVPGAPSTYSRHLRNVESAVAIDDSTLHVRTRRPGLLLPANLAHIAIVDRRIGMAATPASFAFGASANGSGPYRFVEFVPGERIVLAANPHWWGGKPQWERVILRPMRSPAARLAALLAGAVDAINEVPPADIDKLKREDRVALASGTSNRVIFWAMDVSRETSPFVTAKDGGPIANPLRDPRVREAVSLAVDRRAIVERLMEGSAVVAHQIPLRGHAGYIPDLRAAPVDLARARALMAEAGYPNGFRLAVHTTNGRFVNDTRQGQTIAQMLARIGIEASVQPTNIATYFVQARNREFSFMLVGWGHSSTDPLLVMRETFHSTAANNYGGWADAEADRLLDAADVELDPARRGAMLAEVTRRAAAAFAILPTHYQVNFWATRKDLRYLPRRDEATLAQHVVPR
jgi:peptide/nickel transport system substrate-binding protein